MAGRPSGGVCRTSNLMVRMIRFGRLQFSELVDHAKCGAGTVALMRGAI